MKRTHSFPPVKRLFASVIVLAMLAGAFALHTNAAPDTESFAAEVVRLVNAERAKEGLPALNFGNKALNDAAMQRANEFASNTKLGHTRPGNKEFETVLDEYGIVIRTDWTACGENLAEGYPTPERAVAGWMGSTGHRKNIMGGQTDEGEPLNFNWIGVAVCEKGGRLYWAQLFVTSSTLTDDRDGDPGGSVDPGDNNDNGDSGSIFSEVLRWFSDIWDSITAFFSTIFGF